MALPDSDNLMYVTKQYENDLKEAAKRQMEDNTVYDTLNNTNSMLDSILLEMNTKLNEISEKNIEIGANIADKHNQIQQLTIDSDNLVSEGIKETRLHSSSASYKNDRSSTPYNGTSFINKTIKFDNELLLDEIVSQDDKVYTFNVPITDNEFIKVIEFEMSYIQNPKLVSPVSSEPELPTVSVLKYISGKFFIIRPDPINFPEKVIMKAIIENSDNTGSKSDERIVDVKNSTGDQLITKDDIGPEFDLFFYSKDEKNINISIGRITPHKWMICKTYIPNDNENVSRIISILNSNIQNIELSRVNYCKNLQCYIIFDDTNEMIYTTTDPKLSTNSFTPLPSLPHSPSMKIVEIGLFTFFIYDNNFGSTYVIVGSDLSSMVEIPQNICDVKQVSTGEFIVNIDEGTDRGLYLFDTDSLSVGNLLIPFDEVDPEFIFNRKCDFTEIDNNKLIVFSVNPTNVRYNYLTLDLSTNTYASSTFITNKILFEDVDMLMGEYPCIIGEISLHKTSNMLLMKINCVNTNNDKICKIFNIFHGVTIIKGADYTLKNTNELKFYDMDTKLELSNYKYITEIVDTSLFTFGIDDEKNLFVIDDLHIIDAFSISNNNNSELTDRNSILFLSDDSGSKSFGSTESILSSIISIYETPVGIFIATNKTIYEVHNDKSVTTKYFIDDEHWSLNCICNDPKYTRTLIIVKTQTNNFILSQSYTMILPNESLRYEYVDLYNGKFITTDEFEEIGLENYSEEIHGPIIRFEATLHVTLIDKIGGLYNTYETPNDIISFSENTYADVDPTVEHMLSFMVNGVNELRTIDMVHYTMRTNKFGFINYEGFNYSGEMGLTPLVNIERNYIMVHDSSKDSNLTLNDYRKNILKILKKHSADYKNIESKKRKYVYTNDSSQNPIIPMYTGLYIGAGGISGTCTICGRLGVFYRGELTIMSSKLSKSLFLNDNSNLKRLLGTGVFPIKVVDTKIGCFIILSNTQILFLNGEDVNLALSNGGIGGDYSQYLIGSTIYKTADGDLKDIVYIDNDYQTVLFVFENVTYSYNCRANPTAKFTKPFSSIGAIRHTRNDLVSGGFQESDLAGRVNKTFISEDNNCYLYNSDQDFSSTFGNGLWKLNPKFASHTDGFMTLIGLSTFIIDDVVQIGQKLYLGMNHMFYESVTNPTQKAPIIECNLDGSNIKYFTELEGGDCSKFYKLDEENIFAIGDSAIFKYDIVSKKFVLYRKISGDCETFLGMWKVGKRILVSTPSILLGELNVDRNIVVPIDFDMIIEQTESSSSSNVFLSQHNDFLRFGNSILQPGIVSTEDGFFFGVVGGASGSRRICWFRFDDLDIEKETSISGNTDDDVKSLLVNHANVVPLKRFGKSNYYLINNDNDVELYYKNVLSYQFKGVEAENITASYTKVDNFTTPIPGVEYYTMNKNVSKFLDIGYLSEFMVGLKYYTKRITTKYSYSQIDTTSMVPIQEVNYYVLNGEDYELVTESITEWSEGVEYFTRESSTVENYNLVTTPNPTLATRYYIATRIFYDMSTPTVFDTDVDYYTKNEDNNSYVQTVYKSFGFTDEVTNETTILITLYSGTIVNGELIDSYKTVVFTEDHTHHNDTLGKYSTNEDINISMIETPFPIYSLFKTKFGYYAVYSKTKDLTNFSFGKVSGNFQYVVEQPEISSISQISDVMLKDTSKGLILSTSANGGRVYMYDFGSDKFNLNLSLLSGRTLLDIYEINGEVYGASQGVNFNVYKLMGGVVGTQYNFQEIFVLNSLDKPFTFGSFASNVVNGINEMYMIGYGDINIYKLSNDTFIPFDKINSFTTKFGKSITIDNNIYINPINNNDIYIITDTGKLKIWKDSGSFDYDSGSKGKSLFFNRDGWNYLGKTFNTIKYLKSYSVVFADVVNYTLDHSKDLVSITPHTEIDNIDEHYSDIVEYINLTGVRRCRFRNHSIFYSATESVLVPNKEIKSLLNMDSYRLIPTTINNGNELIVEDSYINTDNLIPDRQKFIAVNSDNSISHTIADFDKFFETSAGVFGIIKNEIYLQSNNDKSKFTLITSGLLGSSFSEIVETTHGIFFVDNKNVLRWSNTSHNFIMVNDTITSKSGAKINYVKDLDGILIIASVNDRLYGLPEYLNFNINIFNPSSGNFIEYITSADKTTQFITDISLTSMGIFVVSALKPNTNDGINIDASYGQIGNNRAFFYRIYTDFDGNIDWLECEYSNSFNGVTSWPMNVSQIVETEFNGVRSIRAVRNPYYRPTHPSGYNASNTVYQNSKVTEWIYQQKDTKHDVNMETITDPTNYWFTPNHGGLSIGANGYDGSFTWETYFGKIFLVRDHKCLQYPKLSSLNIPKMGNSYSTTTYNSVTRVTYKTPGIMDYERRFIDSAATQTILAFRNASAITESIFNDINNTTSYSKLILTNTNRLFLVMLHGVTYLNDVMSTSLFEYDKDTNSFEYVAGSEVLYKGIFHIVNVLYFSETGFNADRLKDIKIVDFNGVLFVKHFDGKLYRYGNHKLSYINTDEPDDEINNVLYQLKLTVSNNKTNNNLVENTDYSNIDKFVIKEVGVIDCRTINDDGNVDITKFVDNKVMQYFEPHNYYNGVDGEYTSDVEQSKEFSHFGTFKGLIKNIYRGFKSNDLINCRYIKPDQNILTDLIKHKTGNVMGDVEDYMTRLDNFRIDLKVYPTKAKTIQNDDEVVKFIK